MLSDSRPEERQNSHDNVFAGLSVGPEEAIFRGRLLCVA